MPTIHALPAALTPLLLVLALAACSSGPQAAAQAVAGASGPPGTLPACRRPHAFATAEELRNAEEDVALIDALLLGAPKNALILAQEASPAPAKSGFAACDRLLNALRDGGQ